MYLIGKQCWVVITVYVVVLCDIVAVIDRAFPGCYSRRACWCCASSTLGWSRRTRNARFWRQ